MSHIEWPTDLVRDLARRRCIPFLGAGISQNSQNASGKKPLTWEELLRDLASIIKPNQHILSLLNERDFLTACEVIKLHLGQDQFTRALTDRYLKPGFRPADIHEVIFKLDASIVATTNFDKIYETFANNESQGSILIKHHYDDDVAHVIRDANPVVLKIHGTIEKPNELIFTRRDYASARQEHRRFYELLEALALTNTFLFLGCGFNDPDIRLLLEDILFAHPFSPPHYFVTPSRSLHQSVRNAIEESMNLRFLTYPGATKTDHAALLPSLIDLQEKVEAEREVIKQFGNW